MSNSKVVMSQAANTLTTPLNVEEVFSTYLYEGNSSTQTITNGIDLDGEGGLVWIKDRNDTYGHYLTDTERGAGSSLSSHNTQQAYAPSQTQPKDLYSFNSDGFSVAPPYNSYVNQSSVNHASWTFRKAPKFFDVVTYTGNGSGQSIAHSLGSTPGCIIVKAYAGTNADIEYWAVFHRSEGATNFLRLNTTNASVDADSLWDDTAPTDTHFTVGTNGAVNNNGLSYVAYLFAHNDGDGEFGPDGDADIIKCGSWAGTGSEQTINLGFEPQWVLMKDTEAASNWFVVDNMRGMSASGNWVSLYPNSSSIEETLATGFGPQLVSNGIKLLSTDTNFNSTSRNIIYIAIRRGTKVPESGTEVFETLTYTGTGGDVTRSTNTVVDALITQRTSGGNPYVLDRMRGGSQWLPTSSNGNEGTQTNAVTQFGNDYIDMGGGAVVNASGSDYALQLFKRAPNFFDVVAYTGNGTAGRTVSHNLGVAPEMMWVKKRNGSDWWGVYHKDLISGNVLALNLNYASYSSSNLFTTTSPTDSVFSVGSDGQTNASSNTYIAYLFASLDGVSKVGSYTGNGTSQTIDCGFTSGARFVLIKRTDSTSDWWVLDSERGIAAGDDPYLALNTTAAEQNDPFLDPNSSGFTLDTANGNNSGAEYIFYAIA